MQRNDDNPFQSIQPETGGEHQPGFQHERNCQQGTYNRTVFGDIFPEIRFFHIMLFCI